MFDGARRLAGTSISPEPHAVRERIGHRFARYFHGLLGNPILSGQMDGVLKAAEARLIVLPEHDYQVLRRWGDDMNETGSSDTWSVCTLYYASSPGHHGCGTRSTA